jgi:hypothetical protein
MIHVLISSVTHSTDLSRLRKKKANLIASSPQPLAITNRGINHESFKYKPDDQASSE